MHPQSAGGASTIRYPGTFLRHELTTLLSPPVLVLCAVRPSARGAADAVQLVPLNTQR
jgi:hypothetical protein